MTTRDPIDMLLSGRMGRREFSQTLASLGLGVATVPLVTRNAWAQDEEAHYLTWAGYELPELHQSYIDKHGVSPDIGYFASVNEAMQKLRAGYRADVSHPCSDNVTPWYEAGLLAPIDTDRLSCDANEFADAVSAEGVPFGGPYIGTPDDGPLYRNPFLAESLLYGNSHFPLNIGRDRPLDYRLVECPYGEALMSRNVGFSMVPTMTEDDVGDVIQAMRKVTDHYRK